MPDPMGPRCRPVAAGDRRSEPAATPWPRRLPGCLAVLVLGLFGLALPVGPAGGAEAGTEEVRIGVLALRGEQQALERWQPMAAMLERRSPELEVGIVPLDFDEIRLAVRRRSVDFVLANPAFYVGLEMRYGVSPVVTMQTHPPGLPGPGVSHFGGVLFTRADNAAIESLDDVRGKTLAAVDSGSLGGWLAGWRRLRAEGIEPEDDLAEVRFAGTHDAVVRAVAEGRAEVGIVRTGTLESMVAEGKIEPGTFHVLGPREAEGFPYLLSTALYPEWPLARVPGVSDELAVSLAVLLMQGEPEAVAGWTLPVNYQPVRELLRELEVGPYEHLRHVTVGELVQEYGHWLVIGLLLLLLAWVVVAYVLRINRRLRAKQGELGELNATLESRVEERTRRVETLLERESYLRAIVETVADVNQIIITSDGEQQMLKAACDRLIGHSDYRFAWVATRDPETGRIEETARSYGSASHMRSLVDLSAGSVAARTVAGDGVQVQERVPGNDWARVVLGLPLSPDAYSAPFGALLVFTARPEGFEAEEVAMLEQLAGDLGFAVHSFEREARSQALQQERIDNYQETILSMVDLIEKRDTYTAGHSRRVADYCARIARRMGLADSHVETLYRAAILHDIGKIVIPDAVLLKPARLTDLEFELIQQHVMAGYETLSRIAMYRDLAEMMLHHHERQDGSGYPQGLAGDAIPVEGRIMAVADSFDAMTSDRIYKGRKTVEAALTELQAMAGRQYDATVVEAAVEALAEVEPPASEEQLPSTPVEQKRFAYFFSDQLTGVNNADYLAFVLRGPDPSAAHATVVFLEGFTRFNAEAGWAAGDRVLRDCAAYLEERCPVSRVFRVGGDDFVVLGREPCAIDVEALRERIGGDSAPAIEVADFPVDDRGVERLEQLLAQAREDDKVAGDGH